MIIKDIANKYQRTSGSIINKLRSLGIHKKQKTYWTEEEKEILRQYYPYISKNDIIKKLNNKYNWDSIVLKASRLKIKREVFYWSEDDIAILKEY